MPDLATPNKFKVTWEEKVRKSIQIYAYFSKITSKFRFNLKNTCRI